jgi:5'-methylthioadenosine phosphorylase
LPEASDNAAQIGVIGGSGFYSLLDNVREVKVETPFGPPSDSIFVAQLEDRGVAFVPRHGRHHTIPPHKINYRANIWALKSLGVRYLISPCAAGSLQAHVKPEHFVVCDQYVDRTRGRMDTFYEGPEVYHVSPADPYCPHLRQLAIETIREHGITVHERGTVVVINGPRFSTKSESKWFSDQGWEVISMTAYPEAYLALEQQIAVVNISLITDYDSGLHAEGQVEPVTATEVYEVFKKNATRVKNVVLDLMRRIPLDLDSPQHHSLDYARVSA